MIHPAAENSTLVELRGVQAQLARTRILFDVNLELRRGEHLGIVGANGAGKTTLLKLIGGSLWPAPGHGQRRYFFDGAEHRDAVYAKQRTTLVGPELQDTYVRLGWNFTASAVVVTGLHRTEIPRRRITATERSKAAELLALLHCEQLADRAFLALSRGEQRRVLLARALAFEPEILLLDEPGSGLDTRARADLDMAIAAAAQRATIVATAHAPDSLPAVVTRILEVRDGRVLALAEPAPAYAEATPAAEVEPDNPPARQAGQSKPLLELRNADVWVGERRVLAGLGWALNPGDNWLVTGNNGAGKSTFLRLLHGQLRPAVGGTIRWPAFGNPRNVWQLRHYIGWVSPELQADYRYPTTVGQCVASGFRSSIGLTAALDAAQRARCDTLLAEFELDTLADRLLSSLSYGQARRALLARTLARAPRLLLLDEPWEGLDGATVALLRQRFADVMLAGTQIVCASHIGDGGLGLNRTLHIENGTIRADAGA